jgi:hypothetical protein
MGVLWAQVCGLPQDPDKRDFNFKSTVLATLLKSQLQSIMRSVLIVCRRTRIHHGNKNFLKGNLPHGTTVENHTTLYLANLCTLGVIAVWLLVVVVP